MAVSRGIFFTAENHHRRRAALEQDLADTVCDPDRRTRHLVRVRFHQACLRSGADAYLRLGNGY